MCYTPSITLWTSKQFPELRTTIKCHEKEDKESIFELYHGYVAITGNDRETDHYPLTRRQTDLPFGRIHLHMAATTRRRRSSQITPQSTSSDLSPLSAIALTTPAQPLLQKWRGAVCHQQQAIYTTTVKSQNRLQRQVWANEADQYNSQDLSRNIFASNVVCLPFFSLFY